MSEKNFDLMSLLRASENQGGALLIFGLDKNSKSGDQNGDVALPEALSELDWRLTSLISRDLHRQRASLRTLNQVLFPFRMGNRRHQAVVLLPDQDLLAKPSALKEKVKGLIKTFGASQIIVSRGSFDFLNDQVFDKVFSGLKLTVIH